MKMTTDHKKGDIVKTRIDGEIVNCVVLSDYMTQLEIEPDDYYLNAIGITDIKFNFKICLWRSGKYTFSIVHFLVLIGDQKVYVEYDEIW